jgi:spore coat polysaccharide biosynthesis predicted glycosyltransferase SpsG
MKTILFRTLGGKGIGYGHFFRTRSLATAFLQCNRNLNILFIVNKGLENHIVNSGFQYHISESFEEDINSIRQLKPDLFILDSYLANNEYLYEVKKISKLMIFDDNNNIYDSSIPDVVVNGNIYAKELDYKRNEDSLYLLGMEYLVMREEYWIESTFRYSTPYGILITTGGTDPYWLSYNIAINLKKFSSKKKIVIGPGYGSDLIAKLEEIKDENTELIYMPNSLKRYINESKIVITAGGSTIYEVLSQNVKPIVFSMADNQDMTCRSLADLGVLFLGKYPHIQYDNLGNYILKTENDHRRLWNERFSMIDGQGVFRVVNCLNHIL